MASMGSSLLKWRDTEARGDHTAWLPLRLTAGRQEGAKAGREDRGGGEGEAAGSCEGGGEEGGGVAMAERAVEPAIERVCQTAGWARLGQKLALIAKAINERSMQTAINGRSKEIPIDETSTEIAISERLQELEMKDRAQETSSPAAVDSSKGGGGAQAIQPYEELGLPHKLMLACYPPGGKYVRHSDVSPAVVHRRLTAILYLNEAWQQAHGGELLLYPSPPHPASPHSSPPVAVEPRGGRLLLFRSHLEHEVRATAVERWALTAWLSTGGRGLRPQDLLPPLCPPVDATSAVGEEQAEGEGRGAVSAQQHAEGRGGTIFVSVAAYRDPEAPHTIRSLFEKARYPHRCAPTPGLSPLQPPPPVTSYLRVHPHRCQAFDESQHCAKPPPSMIPLTLFPACVTTSSPLDTLICPSPFPVSFAACSSELASSAILISIQTAAISEKCHHAGGGTFAPSRWTGEQRGAQPGLVFSFRRRRVPATSPLQARGLPWWWWFVVVRCWCCCWWCWCWCCHVGGVRGVRGVLVCGRVGVRVVVVVMVDDTAVFAFIL
ncbi:MAG: hypothetical protein SGPRY_002206 [Prymnesium sp.]